MRFAWVPLLCLPALLAQSDPAVRAARQYRQGHEREVVSSLMDLLAIPAVAASPDGLRKAATEIGSRLQKRGAQVRLLEHPGAPPVVYGEIRRPGATRTVLFYAHYDGQPVNPKEWVTPPFQPTLRNGPLERDGQIIPLPEPGKPFDPEWRIYARSASDDKAPVVSILTALDALRAAQIQPTANLKFIFDGEEEAGSPHLEEVIAANKELLRADVWLICDGPVHQSRASQIVFGVRGVVGFEVTVYGARRELHSGHYGNWSPNPAMQLAQLLASMKDKDGNVIVEGYNDGIVPFGPLEKQAVAETPDVDEALKKELWLGRTEGGGRKLADLINLPSLNIRGFTSSHTGETASNVIPATATASIDLRLVKGITPAQAIARVRAHMEKQGYKIVDQPPDAATRQANPRLIYFRQERGGYEAVRTPMDLPVAQMVVKAAERTRPPVVRLPTLGGSLPLIMIERQLNVPTITIPIANHDNSQHSANENLRLQNLWDGIDLMAALLTMQP